MSTAPEKVCPQSDISSQEGYSMNTLDGRNRLLSTIPGLGRLPVEGNGNRLQYSCLGSPWTEELGGLQFMESLKS